MAFPKLLVFSLFFLTLIFTKINAEEVVGIDVDDVVSKPKVADSSVRLELDHLKSKISLLESSIDERIHELETKNEDIKRLEKIIEEKSISLASLQKEIKLFQEKGSLDAKQQIDEAGERASELEKQMNNLKKEIETQEKKKNALETRTNVAEKKIQDFNVKLESLQKINDEQKSRIRRTERALQAAEEEMMRAKMEADLLSKQLSEVHGGWLPPWLAVHCIHYQSAIVNKWNKHGRPALDLTIQKALEKKTEIEKWVHPQIETFKTEWVPFIKARSSELASDIGPHVRLLSAKATSLYYTSKSAAEPHIIKVQEVIDPYYQEAKKFTKPYLDQASVVMKPHIDEVRIFLSPYMKKVVSAYKKYVKKAAAYHRKVEATIYETLKKEEFTKSFATKELAWYLASALFALPLVFFINIVSGSSRKKPKRRSRHGHTSHTSHTRRRVKRVHPEK